MALTPEQKAFVDWQLQQIDPLKPGGTAGGGAIGVTVVDPGLPTNDTVQPGFGTTGVVYGPDGKRYSSVAAALAAGVTNYSFNKPMLNQSTAGLINSASNQMPTYQQPMNPATGGLITGANDQLFKMPTGVQFPS